MRAGLAVSLALALEIGACVAPRGAEAPASSAPGARATNQSNDILFVRGRGTIAVVSARTGERTKEFADGVLAPEWTAPGPMSARVMYTVTHQSGTTTVAMLDLSNGGTAPARSLSFDGDFVARSQFDGSPGGLSSNGRWLALVAPTLQQTDGSLRSRFAIVDTALAAQPRLVDLPGSFFLVAIADDGASLYLQENLPADHPIERRWRVYDLGRGDLIEARPAAGPPVAGFPFGLGATSPDGKARADLYPVGRDISAPVLQLLRLDQRAAANVALPEWMFSGGEDQLGWSLVFASDGRALYAVNGSLGAIALVDVASATVTRSARLAVARADDHRFAAALLRAILPMAEAKRLIRGGAVLSPDGTLLYAIGGRTILVVSTTTLAVVRRLDASAELEGLALSAGGARIYAVSDETMTIRILDAVSGALLGEIRTPQYTSIIRVE